jgi:hypothetical protein
MGLSTDCTPSWATARLLSIRLKGAATWDRLVQVKARYDPANLFHHNHNIPTAIEEPGQ